VQGAPADRLAIEEWFPNDAFGVNAMPRDGFATLLQDAVQGLDVRLDTPVQRLVWQTEGVVAETATGRFAADRALVTLPVGLLRDGALAFDPPLPLEQRAAIARIGYGAGVLGKIYLRFDQPFWPRDVYRFVGLPPTPDRRGVFNTWLSLERETGAPLLLSFANGQAALRFEKECSDAQVLDEAMASLRRLFGSVPAPAAFCFTRWLADPWSAGSYSYPALCSLPGDRVAYARPLGDRVFFAGEATEAGDYGTVQAALRSGERAAEAVFRYVTGLTPAREARPWRFRAARTA
jgi:monoamine oxidase